MRIVKVGYVLRESLIKSHNIDELSNVKHRNYEYIMVPIDPTKPLSVQNKCDFIIHKIHDYLIKDREFSDMESVIKIIDNFSNELKRLKIQLIDPWESASVLLYRSEVARIITNCAFELNGIKVMSPRTFEVVSEMPNSEFLNLMRTHNLKFPFMTKPKGGILPKFRYEMSLHFSASSTAYKSITDQFKDLIPCTIQQFYNHGGILYKLYIIGDDWHIVARSSIVDIDCNNTDPLYFKSSAINQKTGVSELSSTLNNSYISTDRTSGLDADVINSFVQRLKDQYQFNLIGADIIFDKSTNTYFIVDINYFPGFKGIPDVNEKFLNLFDKFAKCLNL